MENDEIDRLGWQERERDEYGHGYGKSGELLRWIMGENYDGYERCRVWWKWLSVILQYALRIAIASRWAIPWMYEAGHEK